MKPTEVNLTELLTSEIWKDIIASVKDAARDKAASEVSCILAELFDGEEEVIMEEVLVDLAFAEGVYGAGDMHNVAMLAVSKAKGTDQEKSLSLGVGLGYLQKCAEWESRRRAAVEEAVARGESKEVIKKLGMCDLFDYGTIRPFEKKV